MNFRKLTKNSAELIDKLDKMGKTKHKKHHRDENGGDDETNAGLKLVLKVGSKGHEKHKKKKKKKDKKKERDKERGKHHHHHKVFLSMIFEKVQIHSKSTNTRFSFKMACFHNTAFDIFKTTFGTRKVKILLLRI